MNEMTEEQTRSQVYKTLKYLYEKGYRYVVRDKEMPYLTCFSVKPKRYRDLEIWGYVKPGDENALMAYPIKNTDITEIHWNNRSAMPISHYCKA